MRPHLHIRFGDDELAVTLPSGDKAWPADQARRWLDEQFVANDCEPLRASGKVLTADKLLAIAGAVGARALAADEGLRLDFARAATAALGRDAVSIDVDAAAVSF
jgi:hypothetical protein